MNIIFVKWLTKQSALNFVSVRDYYYRFSLSQTSNTGAVLNLSSDDFANAKQHRLSKQKKGHLCRLQYLSVTPAPRTNKKI